MANKEPNESIAKEWLKGAKAGVEVVAAVAGPGKVVKGAKAAVRGAEKIAEKVGLKAGEKAVGKAAETIGSVSRTGESGRVGYKVSENVRVVAPSKEAESVKVSSGAQQAAYQNISGTTSGRITPSSPTKGANMGKPYPGTQANHTVTKVNRKTGKAN